MAICMNCVAWLVFPRHEQCPGRVWNVLRQDYDPCRCTHPHHDRAAGSDRSGDRGQSPARQ